MSTTTEVEYPEHERLAAVKDESQAIGEFIDNGGYTLCQVMYRAPFNGRDALVDHPTRDDERGMFVPVQVSIERVLAEYFDIDLDKIEAEKRAMLDAIRRRQDVRGD